MYVGTYLGKISRNLHKVLPRMRLPTYLPIGPYFLHNLSIEKMTEKSFESKICIIRPMT